MPIVCWRKFLPRAFRRPVDADDAQAIRGQGRRSGCKAGDCFETAMRWAYRAALCSPDFLYHVEPAGKLDDYALACRLSYFFWRSMPDEQLTELAEAGKLREDGDRCGPRCERLLNDPKSQRFVEDFLGQWLKLRQIAATDPDRKLYPEFSPYLQDSMVGETRAYFRELLDKDLDASHLVKSDFAMLNEKLAVHYGIPGRERLADPPRGLARRLAARAVPDAGLDPEDHRQRHDDLAGAARRFRDGSPARPTARTAAAEHPGHRARRARRQDHPRATRQAPHRSPPAPRATRRWTRRASPWSRSTSSAASRTRYRSIGAGDPAPRGSIDPFIGISFKLGPHVDASGVLPDGRTFSGINEFQDLLAADSGLLLKNLARQFAIYGTGRNVSFGDRDQIAAIAANTRKQGGGIRTLIYELIQSDLFNTR